MVSIPNGKGKDMINGAERKEITLYQFPMGKVKTSKILESAFYFTTYQFPMGKVKSIMKKHLIR